MADRTAKWIYAPVPSLFKCWTKVRDGESTTVLIQTYEKMGLSEYKLGLADLRETGGWNLSSRV